MRKRKKFADGGVTGVQQLTYPFYGNQPQAGGQSGGMNQTFNMQPQAMAGPNDQMGAQQRFKKGGQVKIKKVMEEFKAGKLKSSSGQKVTNPKQAIAIGLSEAGLSKKKGGGMAESKAMVKKEVSFMKKKGAPKSMVKHEEAEMKAMKKGGSAKMGSFPKTAMGSVKTAAPSRDGVATKGKTKGKMVKMAGGKGMKKGGYC